MAGNVRARQAATKTEVRHGEMRAIVDEATAATQFGAQVLIQPLVLGCQCTPFTDTRCMAAVDGGGDPDDSAQLQVSALAAWSDPAAARALVGVDLGSIPMLLPDGRPDAFRRIATSRTGSRCSGLDRRQLSQVELEGDDAATGGAEGVVPDEAGADAADTGVGDAEDGGPADAGAE
jgi:hypothetical protein